MGSIRAISLPSSRPRRRRPSGDPPGSRVTTAGSPASSRRSASRAIWVVFPEPSIPSNVTKQPCRRVAARRRGSTWEAIRSAGSTGSPAKGSRAAAGSSSGSRISSWELMLPVQRRASVSPEKYEIAAAWSRAI